MGFDIFLSVFCVLKNVICSETSALYICHHLAMSVSVPYDVQGAQK